MVAHAVVPEVISDDARKVSYWGQKGERTSVVVGALSHSGKAVAGKAQAAQEAGKRNTFLSKKNSWKLAPNPRA